MLIQDQWLTQYFKGGAFKVDLAKVDQALAKVDLAQAKVDLSKIDLLASQLDHNFDLNQPGFYYAKVPIHNLKAVNFLMNNGFYLVETSLQLQQNIKQLQQPTDAAKNQAAKLQSQHQIRPAEKVDCEQVLSIASTAFEHSRFNLDENIPKEVSARIKENWANNFFLGQRGDAMWVATQGNVITGFLLMIQKNIIDLIAVGKEYHRTGVASALIQTANQHLGALFLGTQLSNQASIQLYQKHGFTFHSASYVLHKLN